MRRKEWTHDVKPSTRGFAYSKNGANNDLRYIMLKTKAIATIKEKLFIILQSEKTCESFSVFLYRDYWPFL